MHGLWLPGGETMGFPLLPVWWIIKDTFPGKLIYLLCSLRPLYSSIVTDFGASGVKLAWVKCFFPAHCISVAQYRGPGPFHFTIGQHLFAWRHMEYHGDFIGKNNDQKFQTTVFFVCLIYSLTSNQCLYWLEITIGAYLFKCRSKEISLERSHH